MEAIRVETGSNNTLNGESSGLWDLKRQKPNRWVAVREGFLEVSFQGQISAFPTHELMFLILTDSPVA